MNPQKSFFGTKVSKPGINVNQATDQDLVYKDNFSTKTYYDNNNSRIVEGLLPDGTYGMWVSKPGFNAADSSAATSGNLIFNSNQDIFKIVEKGTTTIPSFTVGSGGDNSALITIAHNLSFTPLVDVYAAGALFSLSNVFIASSYIPLPIYSSLYLFPSVAAKYYDLTILYGIDATNLYIEAISSFTGTLDTLEPIPITYFLRQETAT